MIVQSFTYDSLELLLLLLERTTSKRPDGSTLTLKRMVAAQLQVPMKCPAKRRRTRSKIIRYQHAEEQMLMNIRAKCMETGSTVWTHPHFWQKCEKYKI